VRGPLRWARHSANICNATASPASLRLALRPPPPPSLRSPPPSPPPGGRGRGHPPPHFLPRARSRKRDGGVSKGHARTKTHSSPKGPERAEDDDHLPAQSFHVAPAVLQSSPPRSLAADPTPSRRVGRIVRLRAEPHGSTGTRHRSLGAVQDRQ